MLMKTPVILFGAFDRHNFGDLLFPHVAAALLGERPLTFAGLAERDLRSVGGCRTAALSRLGLDRGEPRAALIHVGGEILTCEAWQAAVMLLPPDQIQPTIAYLESRPHERLGWVRGMVGTSSLAPYAVSRLEYPGLARVIYCGVGGVGLDRVDGAMRAEILARLRSADVASVRDDQTRAQLAAHGIAARLVPDPAVMVAELFGERIRARACEGEVAQMRRTFPRGYIAFQCSADFGDDETLGQLAAQLDSVASGAEAGIALFRAGAAPWHDDLDGLHRLATRLRVGSAKLFRSPDVWDICALIANSRVYCGSSLHGRIVATAFALPRLNLRRRETTGGSSKQQAFAQTWDAASMPAEVGPRDVAAGILGALAADPELLRQTARSLAARYRQEFVTIAAALE
jgi:hypothetical protein